MTKPAPSVNVGDFSMCIKCGGIMQYEEGMTLKALSKEEISLLDQGTQNNLLSLQVMRALLPMRGY
jgi:hypothetical protein